MAITFIDPAQGALSEAIGTLGSGVGQLVFQEEIREARIKNNPTLVQTLVPLARNAVKAGTIPVLAKQFGVREEFVEGLSKLTPTPEQAFGEAFANAGGPEQMAKTQIAELVSRGATATEAIEQNLPFWEARAAVVGKQFDIQNFNFNSDLINWRRTSGVDQFQFNEAAMKAKFGIKGFELMNQQLNDFDLSTPEGRHQAETYATGFLNPAALTHIGLHERMDFDSLVEFSNASGDRYNLTFKMRDAFNEAIDRLQEAQEAGDDQFIERAANDVNTVRFMISEAMESGAIFPIDTAKAEFEDELVGSSVELAEQIFVGDEVQGLAAGFVKEGVENLNHVWRVGEGDEAEIVVSETQPAGGIPFLRTLDPRSREQLQERYPNYRASVLKADKNKGRARSGPRNPETQARFEAAQALFERNLEQELTPEQLARYRSSSSWVEKQKILFESLSEYMRSILNSSGPGRR